MSTIRRVNITSIKQQVKRKDRFSVFIDGEYVFSLGEVELINTGLQLGQELTQNEIKQLKQTAATDKAYDRVLDLISRRRRSEWELREYMRLKDYNEETVNTILNKLSINKYLDDEAFARAWVANRRLLKSTSKRRLIQELRQKRIASETIDNVLAEDETDELQVLHELTEKKRKQTKYQDNLKLMQYLSRQGYSYGDIKTVIDEQDNINT